ncbi:inactive CLIP domain-containing serine protease A28-like [Anopheles moucheti]|uniref:inactive CLIP domain-containing serine protease A28-like n=1 Tax=Anopheles moucheti TaxID=186751 RepID=UPI0022F0EA5F|nr:inactive CLIP domain-containing serine protease A28-like [Anopheles moucheti]
MFGGFVAFTVSSMLLGILIVPVPAQLDGSFWWMNSNLIKQAEALRESKDVKAIVISKDSELDEVRVGGNSLIDSDSPDCICVPLNRCRNQPTGRDGLCGPESVCCRRAQIIPLESTTSSTTFTPPTTSISSTKLEPVDSLVFDSDPAPPNLPTAIPFQPVLLNETEHDPSLLLELSNLLLSHSLVDTFEPIDSNSLPVDKVATDETPQTVSSTTPRIHPTGSSFNASRAANHCGRRQHSISSRIFFQDEDGDHLSQVPSGTVGFSEFPWTVAVYQLIRNGSFVYHCGGALLNRSVVITAAHCVSNNRLHPNRFVVHAGDWDRRHTQERLPHQERTVSRIVVHPDYYSGALFNDIALLFFNEPFNDTLLNVEPVCLGGSEATLTHENCFVTGWGGSPKSNRPQSIQQFNKLSILERSLCETRLQRQPTLGSKFKLHQNFICAQGNGTDVCQGSGGSPFACERNGHYYLLGIVSWGIGCGDGIPAVLTNVANLSSWIVSQKALV